MTAHSTAPVDWDTLCAADPREATITCPRNHQWKTVVGKRAWNWCRRCGHGYHTADLHVEGAERNQAV